MQGLVPVTVGLLSYFDRLILINLMAAHKRVNDILFCQRLKMKYLAP